MQQQLCQLIPQCDVRHAAPAAAALSQPVGSSWQHDVRLFGIAWMNSTKYLQHFVLHNSLKA
jgi:hypothetical protein